jgi:hypothetical protein
MVMVEKANEISSWCVSNSRLAYSWNKLSICVAFRRTELIDLRNTADGLAPL